MVVAKNLRSQLRLERDHEPEGNCFRMESCERGLITDSVTNADVNITKYGINYAQIANTWESFLFSLQNISSTLLSCLGDDIVNIEKHHHRQSLV